MQKSAIFKIELQTKGKNGFAASDKKAGKNYLKSGTESLENLST